MDQARQINIARKRMVRRHYARAVTPTLAYLAATNPEIGQAAEYTVEQATVTVLRQTEDSWVITVTQNTAWWSQWHRWNYRPAVREDERIWTEFGKVPANPDHDPARLRHAKPYAIMFWVHKLLQLEMDLREADGSLMVVYGDERHERA